METRPLQDILEVETFNCIRQMSRKCKTDSLVVRVLVTQEGTQVTVPAFSHVPHTVERLEVFRSELSRLETPPSVLSYVLYPGLYPLTQCFEMCWTVPSHRLFQDVLDCTLSHSVSRCVGMYPLTDCFEMGWTVPFHRLF